MGNIGQTFSRMTGSGSLHKNDWLNVGAMLAAAAAGGPAAMSMLGGAGAGTAGAVAGDAFMPAALAGTNGLAGTAGLGAAGTGLLGGTMGSTGANALSSIFGPSNFTAGMAGDATLPGALGSSGTDTIGMGSKLGTSFGNMGSSGNLLKMGTKMLGQSMSPQQPQQAPQPFRPPGMDQAPPESAQQSLSGVFGQSKANLTPEQMQQLLAMMGH